MRRRLPAAVGLLAVLASLLVPLGEPAGAASSVDQLRRDRRAVQEKRAAQAAEIDVLQADGEEISQALETLQRNVQGQEAALAAARQRSAAEAARAEQAKESEARTVAALEELRTAIRRMAIDEYIHGGAAELDVVIDLTEPMETARRRSLLNSVVGRSSDVAGRLRQAEEDLALERAAAEEAAAQAAAQERRVAEEVSALRAKAAQQVDLAQRVEERLEHALAEADSLARFDSDLASRITKEQAAIASRLRASSPGSRSGTSTRPRVIGSGSLTSVRGIVVASSIAGNLAALLDAAEADGVVLSGWGYRDPSQQIATRRNNCGTSDYDMYEKPASECQPPTARPGHSMHEQALAIDFTQNGSILTRSSSGFRWLQANASRFGLRNLPSEPWHWSTNGN